MYRPPRQSQSGIADRRRAAQSQVNIAAAEMAEDPTVIASWKSGDEKGLIALCKKKEFAVGEPAFVTTTMIYNALKGILRST